MENSKIKVAAVFGGRSVEHEVSIVTAMQAFESIDRDKYEIIPVYIDKSGRWLVDKRLEKIENFKNLKLSGVKAPEYIFQASPSVKVLAPQGFLKSFFNKIRADIYMPLIHGTFGEDGTLQGLFEMAGIPYTGCGVAASAIGMDKIIQKAVFKDAGIPVVKYSGFLKSEWENDRGGILKNVEQTLGYPVFVKPANLGSSVGISKAGNIKELENAIDIAVNFDRRIVVEEGKENIVEINCSVLGNEALKVSVCEQPIKVRDVLTYEDKYLKGGKTKGMAGLSRLVPAPINEELTKRIQEMSLKAFKAIDASGISRIDFMARPESGEFWITEINTLPGSLSFYLWEKSGLDFPDLLDKLIELGFERHKNRQALMFSYDSELISKTAGGIQK
ncbi:D-alanine--D-alanine ligase [Candidatus Azambacteria bacterium]|nr:D-alanine--D-alanine ligase [Candidatus Azambacteria bacterium]